MDPRFSWPVGPATPPGLPPPSFVVPRASRASPLSHQDVHPSDYYPGISGQPPAQSDSGPCAPIGYVDPGYYNITPPHQYRLPSTLNSETSIGPDFNSNLNSNVLNYPYSPSDSGESQYAFSPQPQNGAPHSPPTLSEGTGSSMTPPDSGSLMSHQLVPDTNDPDLQQLGDAIANRRRSLGHEPVPDLYVAQFFLIESVPGSRRPVRKRGEKPVPGKILEYKCLWCRDWVGYSKEKARQHFLIDFDMKGFTCVEPGCERKTAQSSDLRRHMELVHKQIQPKKKSGGAMRAGKPFLKLQEAYRNGARAFPVDVDQNPSHLSAATNGLIFAAHTQETTSHLEMIGGFSQFIVITGSDQVCLLPRTRHRDRGCKALAYRLRWWHIWVTTMFAIPGIAYVVVYSVRIRTLAEHLFLNSAIAPKLTSNSKSTQIESFLWSVISSVLGSTIMTIPAHIQNNENSKDIPKLFLMASNKQNPPDP